MKEQSKSLNGYNLAIPKEFAYVAQAIALNEYRGDTLHPYGSVGAFPLESIMAGMFSPVPVAGQTRIERGFLGSHADIGGGFARDESQLAQVALAWMVQQAKSAGVAINELPYDLPATAVLHDKSDSIQRGAPRAQSEDREVRYTRGSTTTQREMPVSAGMSYQDTQTYKDSDGKNLIDYLPANDPARFRSATDGQNFVTGTVNMVSYLKWLRDNGYDLGSLQVK